MKEKHYRKDATKETVKRATKETVKRATKEIVKRATEETVKRATEETVEKTAKETTNDNVKKVTREMMSAEPQAAKKKLEDMNLLDDFLFGSVVAYPEIGERFVRCILKTIFGREFKRLSVTAQKVFYGADTSLHGTRLDVYMEPQMEDDAEDRAVVYDIEPDQKNKPADIKALPRRVRFYHGKIAARSLNSGADYDDLKNVVIIMIMPYDPFGRNRMVYTIKNKCVELPKMEYEDGASTLFLYTKGTEGIPNAAVEQLLHYMENTTYENAVNEELREIHRMIETVKRDPEVGRMRIQILEENYELKQENVKLVETNTKQADKITEQADEITKQADKITEQADEITKQADKITEQADEITKQAEEIKRLREELNRRSWET